MTARDMLIRDSAELAEALLSDLRKTDTDVTIIFRTRDSDGEHTPAFRIATREAVEGLCGGNG